ncbi:MAG: thiolase family protein [Lachnospiraceae bacterium]|nr:thiolase family protein [Lachnospiraceae bacterium]
MNPINKTTLHPYSRSVSIIGVGCSPFMNTLDDPETAGLTEGELFGYAAYKAMEDAGIRPKDVDYFFHGEANPFYCSNYITPNIQVSEWFGMRGKGSIHHSEACCTGYLALEEAVNAVASGKYNVVLSGCVEFGDAIVDGTKPSFMRRKFDFFEFQESLKWIYDNTYTREMMCGPNIHQDDGAEWYKAKYGLTDEQMDDTLIHMAINSRRGAVLDPLAISKKTYEEIAKENGFDDVMEYMKSFYNPMMSGNLRASGLELKCDGAAACIVCPTEMVSEFTDKKGIEVLGIGNATREANQPHVEVIGTQEATRQVYELTGVKPEEIDILYANDFFITSQLIAAEISGYLPEGEGWKYFIDGRTAFDGDKPINTNGGRCSFGHAHAASGMADIYEAVMQMRGECGARQVKKLPKTAFLRGFGGAQNLASIILRTAE